MLIDIKIPQIMNWQPKDIHSLSIWCLIYYKMIINRSMIKYCSLKSLYRTTNVLQNNVVKITEMKKKVNYMTGYLIEEMTLKKKNSTKFVSIILMNNYLISNLYYQMQTNASIVKLLLSSNLLININIILVKKKTNCYNHLFGISRLPNVKTQNQELKWRLNANSIYNKHFRISLGDSDLTSYIYSWRDINSQFIDITVCLCYSYFFIYSFRFEKGIKGIIIKMVE